MTPRSATAAHTERDALAHDQLRRAASSDPVTASSTPGALVAARSWDDYDVGRADAIAHLGALDIVYRGVVEAHRTAIEDTEKPDPVTQDMLIGQSAQLEQFHWFVRAHLEDASGRLSTGDADAEQQAAGRAEKAAK